MSSDPETVGIYNAKAAEYAELVTTDHNDPQLETFVSSLPKGSHILDLGCGPGFASAFMAQAGHHVTATDASAQMVAMAAKHTNVTAHVASFDDITGTNLYDGIWANFSLLHAPRPDMPCHLAALRQVLKPGGLFHIGMKTGTGMHRDALGRMYTYYTADELHGLLKLAGFTPFFSTTGRDKGLDGTLADWVTIAAHG
ncbi:bifunctional 2-polyprenyl-6-hydroxyphenol methylase/3-demethylubiquinol 3-O-methyltransferase UbiG [Roseovarius sp. EL26]|uniref:class I SAM-dependent methyltransferase n=1 Tax=Roseovarius sp. EL26 TaxID=2126672 RepID=UPI000EA1A585|nr:class I SAM-dependent methyltransferase [Roseovarius sp. EL26]